MPVSPPTDWYVLTHGSRGLLIGYGVVSLAMLAGFIQRGVALRRLLWWPLLALVVTAVTTAIWIVSRWSWELLGMELPQRLSVPISLLLAGLAGYMAGLLFARSSCCQTWSAM